MKIYRLKIIPLVFLLLIFPALVWAKSWDFEKWTSEITLNPDSSFRVRETYVLNFEGSFSWFERDIALKKIKKISEIKVYDEGGRQLAPGEFETKRGIGQVSIKINMSAQDEQKSWTIEYLVQGAVGFFADYDELYWNVTGDQWAVPKREVETVIHLPQSVPTQQLRQRLFIGPIGSQDQAQTYEIVDGQTLRYWGENINPYEHFTIVAGWPKGLVKKDWWLTLADYLWLILPAVVFCLLFWRWKKVGRDPKAKGTVIAQYDPPRGMAPAEMGALLHERSGVQDISATLVDLAYRGYLKIVEQEEKGIFKNSQTYHFSLEKDFHGEPGLKEHERQVLGGVFGGEREVALDDLKNQFYREIPGISSAVMKQIVTDGYYPKDPRRVMQKYIGLGFLALIVAGFLVFGAGKLWPGLAVASSALIAMIFGRFMPAKTSKGAEAKWHTLGFKEYLEVAERFRLQANVDPKLFEKYLSYAMVLGVEKQWANRFADIYNEPPDWYVPAYAWATFSIVNFSSNISAMSTSFSSVLSSSPSSSSGFGGGGSAGGGGGGGGGGAG